MKRICVYCGSSTGNHPEYADAARQLARLLAERGIEIVYGAGNVGIMGVLADAMLEAGGRIIGVIPGALMDLELGHSGLTEMHVVESMHDRKAMMEELSDGFIALPGGFGTFEEILEVTTWAQLGMHEKPCALLNVEGYYDNLIAMLDRAVADEFLKPIFRSMIMVDNDPVKILERFDSYEPPHVRKWITENAT